MPTLTEGVIHLPEYLDRSAQEALLGEIRAVVREAPLFVPRSVDLRTVAHRATNKQPEGTLASVPVQPDGVDQSHPKAIFVAQDDTGDER